LPVAPVLSGYAGTGLLPISVAVLLAPGGVLAERQRSAVKPQVKATTRL
jgi:hypothetical protein